MSFHATGLSKLTIVSINAWPGNVYVLPLQRESQRYQQNSADITFKLVMLLAVEEQIFATLADALLKQTNRKNKEGINQKKQ